MARSEGAFVQRVFRRADPVTLTAPDGETVKGRGIIAALRRETDQPGGKRHALGLLTRPPYHFTGWLEETAGVTGGEMEQAGIRYRVLDSRRITLGSREIGVRCLLEREDGESE